MDFDNIKITDVRNIDTFNRIGYTYTKLKQTDNAILWEMHKSNNTPYKQYEVWMKKILKYKGKEYWVKPNDEDFGTYGLYVVGNEAYCKQRLKQFGFEI